MGKNIFTLFWPLLSVTGGIKFYLLMCVYVLEKGGGGYVNEGHCRTLLHNNHTQEQANSLFLACVGFLLLHAASFFSCIDLVLLSTFETQVNVVLFLRPLFFFIRKMGLHLFLQIGRIRFMSFGSLFAMKVITGSPQLMTNHLVIIWSYNRRTHTPQLQRFLCPGFEGPWLLSSPPPPHSLDCILGTQELACIYSRLQHLGIDVTTIGNIFFARNQHVPLVSGKKRPLRTMGLLNDKNVKRGLVTWVS